MTFDEQYRQAVLAVCQSAAPGFTELKAFCLSDGKRLRPELLLDAASIWTSESRSLTYDERVREAAIGVELLHDYFLIHDDIMDGDELRRDQPTLHVALSARFGAQAGVGLALALGDYLVNEALRYCLAGGESAGEKAALAALFAEITRETIMGQIGEYVGQTDWTLETLEEFYAYKTAAYSIRLPWLMADILAGTSKDRVKAIYTAARELGIAYQLNDDLIEFIGKKKRAAEGGGDIARGKMTVVARLLLDRLPAEPRAELLEAWQTHHVLSSAQIGWLRVFAEEQGILKNVDDMIREHVDKAQQSIIVLDLQNVPSVVRVINLLTVDQSHE